MYLRFTPTVFSYNWVASLKSSFDFEQWKKKKREVKEEGKSSWTVGLRLFVILDNVSSSPSWSPEKWRLVHNRSRSVQDQYKRSVLSVSLLVIIWNILYSMTFKQSISCHLVFIIWFCPDRDHRKGVIKLGLRARARGERRSREKRGMTGIFFALCWCSCVSISFFFSIIP